MIQILIAFMALMASGSQIFLPINCKDRQDISSVRLTEIGAFGLMRKARKTVPAHFHTGIDIKRTKSNYQDEPIFPLAAGRVISKRTDGPYASIIVEHNLDGLRFWSVYEHVAGIQAKLGDLADPQVPLARFMSREELDKYGWQFDHFHLEILKTAPKQISPTEKHPERRYIAHTLNCFTANDLEKYYFEPMSFLKKHLR